MKNKLKYAFMDVAKRFSKLSTAKRMQVGSIIVKDGRILSIGYNGTPSGWDNTCEYMKDGEIVTKPEVIHAEANSLAKLAKANESAENSEMFITHSPCLECAKQIYGAGIKKIYYITKYRCDSGINFLKECGIEIEQLENS